MKNKLITIIKDLSFLMGVSKLIGDKTYLKIIYRIKMGRRLDLGNPKTFNEKLQWLKLYDRKDIYTTMVDKCEVKKYVAKIIGKEYIIPTIGVYDTFDDIDFNELPKQFVMKCTHDSGGLVICRDKSKLDIEETKKKITKCLKRNYYYAGREWPYKNVKPRIIVEKYMEDKKDKELRDYKLFCFNGRVGIILVCSNRFSSGGLKETWFSPEWKLLNLTEGGHGVDKLIRKPTKLKLMKDFSSKISKDIPFVRVDFYEVEKRILFGEITFFPCSGHEHFDPIEWDRKLGDMIDLTNKKGKTR